MGVAVHETMHALGIAHEHARADRDEYIQVRWDHINPQNYDEFAILDPAMFTSFVFVLYHFS